MPPEFDFARERGRDEAVDRFWDQVTQGRSAPAGDLDPADAATIRHLHAFDDRPAPNPAFRRKLREELMYAHAIPISSGPGPLTLPNSRPTRHWGIPAAPPNMGERGRWALAQAATALLLVATLLIAYFTTFRQDERPVLVPAAGTPVPVEVSPNDWPTFLGNAARDGRAGSGPLGEPVQRWRFQTGGPVGNSQPAVVAGVIYAASGDGYLYALDAATGEERWRFAAETGVGGSPTVAAGVVYVADGAGTLYAVETATGTERWRFGSPVNTSSAPAVVGDLLYVGTGDGELLAIETANGNERWRFAMAEEGAVNTAAVADGLVYVGSEAGGFAAIDALTGEERWRSDTGDDALGTARVADGIAYIGGSGGGGAGHLYAFDALSGDLLWRLDEALYSPAVLDGVAYSGSFGGTFVALDPATGAEHWRIELGGPLRPYAVVGDVLYVPSDGDRAVYALDAATGAQLWSFDVDGGINGGIAVADGVAYGGTLLGSVYAIEGSGLEQFDAPEAPAGTPQAGAGPAAQTTVAAVEKVWEIESTSFGVFVAPDGNVWVFSPGGFDIFDPSGQYVETWAPAGIDLTPQGNLDALGGVAFDEVGNIYVVAEAMGEVRKYDAQRRYLASFGEAGGVAFDSAGNLFVADGVRNKVQKFAPDGTFLLAFGGFGAEPGQFNEPVAIAIDGQDRLYVGERGNDRVQVFAHDGTHLATYGSYGTGNGQFDGLNYLDVDEHGTVYVVDSGNHRIQVLAADGTFLTAWSTNNTGDAQYVGPDGIALDGQGHVYMSEPEANRVQKFRLLPPLAPQVTATPEA